MDYIDKNLEKNEKVLAKAKINWFIIVLPIILTIIIEIIIIIATGLFKDYTLDELIDYYNNHNGELPFGYELDYYSPYGVRKNEFKIAIVVIVSQLLAFIPLIAGISTFLTNKLAVTNNRVMGKVGIFSITAIDFPIQNVETVMLKATFWGRIFHFYTLSIRGTGGSKRTIKCVSNANEVKNAITFALKKHADDARKLQAMEIATALTQRQSFTTTRP